MNKLQYLEDGIFLTDDKKKIDVDSFLSKRNIPYIAVEKDVQKIIDNVRKNGDKALFKYIKEFDKVSVNSKNIVITKDEIEKRAVKYQDVIDKELKKALDVAKENIYNYHLKQQKEFETHIFNTNNKKVGWVYRPIENVAIYVPSGKAFYPSTVLMCVLPALAAGVKNISLITAKVENPLLFYVAYICGVSKIYNMGGAHGVAACAFGTESVEKVDLIAGPGNAYVAAAKKLLYGHVGIDMVAGPSEICVIADESADIKYVARDLLSQAEHDEDAGCYLITTSEKIYKNIENTIKGMVLNDKRQNIINKALENSLVIKVESLDDAFVISNKIAPEHLEIQVDKNIFNFSDLIKVQNAGTVFVGEYSMEPLGDYIAGPSHCLPTSSTARFQSTLSVSTFMKRMNYIEYSKESFEREADYAMQIANIEGLRAHANAIKVREEKENEKKKSNNKKKNKRN